LDRRRRRQKRRSGQRDGDRRRNGDVSAVSQVQS
jgi:hypothetical protein